MLADRETEEEAFLPVSLTRLARFWEPQRREKKWGDLSWVRLIRSCACAAAVRTWRDISLTLRQNVALVTISKYNVASNAELAAAETEFMQPQTQPTTKL